MYLPQSTQRLIELALAEDLSGGDITVIKAIGISGSSVSGEILLGRCLLYTSDAADE